MFTMRITTWMAELPDKYRCPVFVFPKSGNPRDEVGSRFLEQQLGREGLTLKELD